MSEWLWLRSSRQVVIAAAAGVGAVGVGVLLYQRCWSHAAAGAIRDDEGSGKQPSSTKTDTASNNPKPCSGRSSPESIVTTCDSEEVSKNPNEAQIMALAGKMPPEWLVVAEEHKEVELPSPLHSSPHEWVATPDALQRVRLELEGARQIAVDCEHNALRSYHGTTCLLQLSDGVKDYLIDCLELRDQMQELSGIFQNPLILKVFHGGENDVLWLQKDFHLYIVNLADTQKLAGAAGCKSQSLGYLLKALCGIETKKAYQLADWRLRPLPAPLAEYARADVHYLLCLYGRLLQRLKQSEPASWRDKLLEVNRRSQTVAAASFSKRTHEEAVRSAATALTRQLAQQQSGRGGDVARDCVHALCKWRDQTSREVDEGPQYVLPDLAIAKLATSCSLASLTQMLRMVDSSLPPEGSQGKFGHCSQASEVSWVLKERAEDVFSVLQKAQKGELPWRDFTQPVAQQSQASKGHTKKQQMDKEELKQKLVQKFSAKGPVYENCRMLSMAGEVLCHCDRRKMKWYIKKGLAAAEEGEENTIRLTFQHRNSDQVKLQKTGADQFYAESRANHCVVCGESGHYLRYRVVPSCYRKNFPTHLKSHRSHDIVLVCIPCHEAAQKSAHELKKEIAEEFQVPLLKVAAVSFSSGGECLALPESVRQSGISMPDARRAALALSQHGANMPDSRRQELENVIKLHLGRDPATESQGLLAGDLDAARVAGVSLRRRKRVLNQLRQDVQKGLAGPCASGLSYPAGDELAPPDQSVEDSECESSAEASSSAVAAGETWGHDWHGRQVVAIALETGGEERLLSLVRRFRQQFVDSLQPRHLPHGWDIEHNAKREFGPYSVFFSEDPTASGD